MATPSSTMAGADTRLIGGVHRDVTGRADEPLRFYLSFSRGLKSGKLDNVNLDEEQILRLIVDGAKALQLLRSKQGERT
jgi:hypothetical protein